MKERETILFLIQTTLGCKQFTGSIILIFVAGRETFAEQVRRVSTGEPVDILLQEQLVLGVIGYFVDAE
jgi:hypothetical protein